MSFTSISRGGVCLLVLLGCAIGPLAPARPALGQEVSEPQDGTPVKRVDLDGLRNVSESYVRRILKTRSGQNYVRQQVQDDIRELLRTRKFLDVSAATRMEAGELVVVFALKEKPEIEALEISGEKQIKRSDIDKELTIAVGQPMDRYEVGRTRDNILRKYREEGYYYASVTVDEAALDEGRVVITIVEGPRVRVRKIAFEGVRSFPELALRFRVRTGTYFPILAKGAFDDEQADRDALELQNFYRAEGYLDARVGYRVDIDSVDRSRLTLVFVVEEGQRYRIKEVRFSGNTVFTDDQLREGMALVPEAIAREDSLRSDARRIEDRYGEIGYVDARVDTAFDFVEEPGVAVLRITINEGTRSKLGRITVRGNVRTKDEVVRRELRFYPGEEFNTVKTRKAERRLAETGLFKKATVTPLEDIEGEREALVEVEEADAVNILFGAGFSSDSGLIGSVTLENRNFDLFDWPRNFSEFIRGQAFRGDGQRMRIVLEPGTEVSRFRIDFTEPYLFDRRLRFDASLYYFSRDRGPYDEERLGVLPSLSHRFEGSLLDSWAVEGAIRLEAVEISDIDPLAARDIRDVRGNSTLTSVKGALVRDTTDSRLFPTEGYRLSFSWEQAGLLGGDYEFSKPQIGFAWYKTMSTDALDRKSVLAAHVDTGWIFGDAPVFERFYGGGFGSIRGFAYRGISPRAGLFNNRVGGDFIFLTGAEYSIPLYANTVRGAAFIDMGTVDEGFSLSDWRVAAGFGLRINLEVFGGVAPMVFDFGFPLLEQDGDDVQIFQFSVGTSF